MKDFDQLLQEILAFRNQRDWEQFNNPKDMALSLNLESAEVLEHFQWKNGDELKEYLVKHKEDIAEELSDVLYWVLLLSHDLGIDLVEASKKKMEKNAKKYPIEKSKGVAKKYNQL